MKYPIEARGSHNSPQHLPRGSLNFSITPAQRQPQLSITPAQRQPQLSTINDNTQKKAIKNNINNYNKNNISDKWCMRARKKSFWNEISNRQSLSHEKWYLWVFDSKPDLKIIKIATLFTSTKWKKGKLITEYDHIMA